MKDTSTISTMARSGPAFLQRRISKYVKSTHLAGILVAFATAMSCSTAVSASWHYGVDYDDFEGEYRETATLSGSGKGLNFLSIDYGQKTTSVRISAGKMVCFPRCAIRVKFDDAAPVDVVAFGAYPLSHTLRIGQVDSFLLRLGLAKRIVVRVPRLDISGDIVFEQDNPIDHSQWEVAKKNKAISKACQENAVNEDFRDCVARQGI